MSLKLEGLTVDTKLQELKRQVTQEHINLYATVSGDFNPIHIDQEFARKTPLRGTVAHGMLVLGYISEFMTNNFGQNWLRGGSLNARFKVPARPGDLITISGKINAVQKENEFISILCDVFCQNQQNESVIICETKVKVNADEDCR
jgi:3-hydroxybutyryl-CoA dehydratase